MILPHPETDFNQNIIVISSSILKELKKHKTAIFYDELFKRLSKINEKVNYDIFIKCILFLFLVGLVDKDGFKIKAIKIC